MTWKFNGFARMSKERKDFDPAYLVSEGLHRRRATLHVFDHLEPGKISAGVGRTITVSFHIYRCTETGSMRRWGFEGGASTVEN